MILKKTINYKDTLLQSLKNPEEAALYLSAALEEEAPEAFLLALRNVAEAVGLSSVSEKSKLNRENMYRMLSEKGNPEFSSLSALLKTLGLQLAVKAKE
ncbi:MAG: putative addiction module antidote protein [Nitrospirae bacterium YQR-1]